MAEPSFVPTPFIRAHRARSWGSILNTGFQTQDWADFSRIVKSWEETGLATDDPLIGRGRNLIVAKRHRIRRVCLWRNHVRPRDYCRIEAYAAIVEVKL